MPAAPLRSGQSVTIDAPLEAVWEYNSDLSRIADFHPRVDKVELIDGQSQRAAGVGYKCHLRGARHTCIERDVEGPRCHLAGGAREPRDPMRDPDRDQEPGECPERDGDEHRVELVAEQEHGPGRDQADRGERDPQQQVRVDRVAAVRVAPRISRQCA